MLGLEKGICIGIWKNYYLKVSDINVNNFNWYL